MLLTKTSLLFALFVSTLYWLVLFIRLISYKETLSYAKNPRPSVIICMKNEEECLKENFSTILAQKLVKKVLVMDDYSTDNTSKILADYSNDHPHLEVFKPSKDLPGKKLALSEGIQKAKTPNILLTDGDCKPASNEWAQLMNSKFDEQHKLVLGYGPLFKSNTYVNGFARFETVLTAVQYFGFALSGSAYMGVGRNMAFSKDLFTSVNGYAAHSDLASGDDDLFVQSIIQKTKAAISLNPNSFCFSKGPASWKEFIKQKKRHIATSSRYTLKHKLLLSVHPIFHLLSFFLGLLLLGLGAWKFVVLAFGLRWLTLITIGYIPFKKLDASDLIWLIPIFDLTLVFYYIYFSLGAFTSSSQNATWE